MPAAGNQREALRSADLEASVEKITDVDAIMNMGVVMTPALAVDGVVKSAGKVLAKDEIARLSSHLLPRPRHRGGAGGCVVPVRAPPAVAADHRDERCSRWRGSPAGSR